MDLLLCEEAICERSGASYLSSAARLGPGPLAVLSTVTGTSASLSTSTVVRRLSVFPPTAFAVGTSGGTVLQAFRPSASTDRNN